MVVKHTYKKEYACEEERREEIKNKCQQLRANMIMRAQSSQNNTK